MPDTCFRATKKFAEMQLENEQLKDRLETTKREFKNFVFNIQAYYAVMYLMFTHINCVSVTLGF